MYELSAGMEKAGRREAAGLLALSGVAWRTDEAGLLSLPGVVWRTDEAGLLSLPGVAGKNSCGLASLQH
jgi:hypothetical protein